MCLYLIEENLPTIVELPRHIAELERTSQKPVIAVQNFHKCLQACMNKTTIISFETFNTALAMLI